jgi:ring-1,2-phenylacetyl-CoA epoxidase subunit PaaC
VNAQELLALADDELILGWRNSEWTGIAPFLEEDVAFSSIAQTEIGHARAWYELAAKALGTDADALAFDRQPEEYQCCALVEKRLVPRWEDTIVRHYYYETADAIRIEALQGSDDAEIASLAEKIDREEVYHRIHAEMWIDRLLSIRGEDSGLVAAAFSWLYPYALGILDQDLRPLWVERVRERTDWDLSEDGPLFIRGQHLPDLSEVWEEMTMVRRSVPGATW